MNLIPIARVAGPLKAKFGTPRQSGLVPGVSARIVFEPEFRDANALRGLEGFSHLWLIWGFHLNRKRDWSPTIRPPRLGGNERVGVFASRSPYRPNPIGLSCVKLEGIEQTPEDGAVLLVSGADLVDGTPIYDIKPYLPFTDSRPEATSGYVETRPRETLTVEDPAGLLDALPERDAEILRALLAQDPRPAYREDPDLPYGMRYAEWDVRFTVESGRLRLTGIAPAGTEDVK